MGVIIPQQTYHLLKRSPRASWLREAVGGKPVKTGGDEAAATKKRL